MSLYGEVTQAVRSRLGEKFVSVDEAATLAGCEYGSRALFTLERGLETISTMLCIENGCALLPGPAKPLSFLALAELRREELFPDLEVPWYGRQRFAAEETVGPSWYAIRTVPFPGTLGKPFAVQKEMLGELEVLPTAVELLWAMATLRMLRGMFMLPFHRARTASVSNQENPVVVGTYGEEGVFTSDRYGQGAVADIAVISKLIL